MPPRSQRRAQKKAGDTTRVIITVDGETYVFDSSEINYKAELELFQQSKLTMAGVFTALGQENFAPFMIAALVFLSRRSNGDTVTFDQVAGAIEYSSEIEFKIPDASDAIEAEVVDLPEAPAAS